MKLYELDAMIKINCPIHGLSSDGRIDFRPTATDAEKVAAQAIMDFNLPLLVGEL